MVPIAVWVRPDGEWSLLHRCTGCGFIRANRIAGDDNEASLLAIAATPLSRLPFPLDSVLSYRHPRHASSWNEEEDERIED